MADNDRNILSREIDNDCTEDCDGCKVTETVNCQSCGMPMTGPEHYGGGDEENKYCVHCCTADGNLKKYEEVFEGMVGLMMKNRGLDRSAAEEAAGEYLAAMPAWGRH